MQISAIANLNVYETGVRSPPPAPKSTAAPAAEDTVQLSAAAKAVLAGGDTDHDRDSH